MNLHTQSLFLKFFFWFWATVIVIALSMALTFVLEPTRNSSRWHENLSRVARYSGAAVIEELERNGAPAASAYISEITNTNHMTACLFDSTGTVIAGAHCETFARSVC